MELHGRPRPGGELWLSLAGGSGGSARNFLRAAAQWCPHARLQPPSPAREEALPNGFGDGTL